MRTISIALVALVTIGSLATADEHGSSITIDGSGNIAPVLSLAERVDALEKRLAALESAVDRITSRRPCAPSAQPDLHRPDLRQRGKPGGRYPRRRVSLLSDVLPIGTVVDLSFSGDSCTVRMLPSEEVSERSKQAGQVAGDLYNLNLKKAPDEKEREKNFAELQAQSQRMQCMWKVTHIADDAVRFESILRLPFHEPTPWVIVPFSKIRVVKGPRLDESPGVTSGVPYRHPSSPQDPTPGER